MNLSNKKVLVTGSSGFIGENLKARLIKEGAQVTTFDKRNGDDVQDEKKVAGTLKNNFDIIYHLAGLSGSAISNKNAIESFKINTLATIKMLALVCKISPKTKIILSSSRLEYGTPKKLPVGENHPTEPNSIYGLSKLLATQYALVLAKTQKLNVTILRTSNTYGPHEKEKFHGYNLINHFIDLAKSDKEIVIFGHGDQLRDYIYIDDLIDAFILANQKISSGKIYNLGYGKGVSLMEMATLIVEKTGKGNIVSRPWPQEYKNVETGSYISDIRAVNKDLNFVPRTTFVQGIIKTINN